MRLHAWVMLGVVVSTGCQCLDPVREVDPQLDLDASTAEAFTKSLLADTVCGQAIACGTMSSHVTCAELVNEPGNHYFPAWNAQVAAALDAGAVVYDAVEGQRCLERLRTECGLPSCSRDALRGQRAAGELCALSMECRPGLWCDGPELTCPRCVPFFADGTDTRSLGGCPEALTGLSDGGLRCHAFRRAGQACALGADEQWGTSCAPGLACVAGVCTTPLSEGGFCTPEACAPNLVCGDAGRCAPRGELGEPCGTCLQGLQCRDGTCARLGLEGAACRFAWECRAPNGCLGGVCRPLGAVGATCTTVMDCEGHLACVGGTCRTPRGLDEPCANLPSECASGLTCDGARCRLLSCR